MLEVLATFQITGYDLIITGNRTYFYNSNYNHCNNALNCLGKQPSGEIKWITSFIVHSQWVRLGVKRFVYSGKCT